MIAILASSCLSLLLLAPPPPLALAHAGAGARPSAEEPERLEAWPAPADAKALESEVLKLRKARTEEMERSAREALGALGAAAAPALLSALEHEKDAAARARVVEMLVACTDARHTRLLARELESRSGALRSFALARLAALPDAGLREAAGQALARAEKAADKAGPKDLEAREERELAALFCAATGSGAGLEHVLARAERAWAEEQPRLRVALAPLKGSDAVGRLAAELEAKGRARKLAALRLLALCGDERALPALRPLLDATERDLQSATVDALRAIVDGEEPLGPIPVFELIEHLQRWKERLQ